MPTVVGVVTDTVSDTVDRLRQYGTVTLTFLNFALTAFFAAVLGLNAFNLDSVDANAKQVFYTDSLVQTPADAADLATATYHPVVRNIGSFPELVPKLYETASTYHVLRMEAVHPNFMLFVALWIASAFALCAVQIPKNLTYWPVFRVAVVHFWNLVGVILTVVVFTATTQWKTIPLSNLFFGLLAQGVAWLYQYFYMVECTQAYAKMLPTLVENENGALVNMEQKHGLQMQYNTHDDGPDPLKKVEYVYHMRKIMFMEFSIVVPFYLVCAMLPGNNGLDSWRVQAVLYGSYTFYALLALHMRYEDAIETHDEGKTDKGAKDALGYLTWAIVVCFFMIVNAFGTAVFYQPGYYTTRIAQAKVGAGFIVVIGAYLVGETLLRTVILSGAASARDIAKRFASSANPTGFGLDEASLQQYMMLFTTFVVWGLGSILPKILLFAGVSDVNSLSIYS